MPPRTWSDQELRAAVTHATSLTAVLRELGLRAAGGNHASIRGHIERLGLDTSHFRRPPPPRRAPVPLEAVLVRGSVYHRGHLKERLYEAGLKEPRCELCGQDELWRGKRMSLILDHVNGEHDDNRLENLRIVCPNCNATLDTHCGRRGRTTIEDRSCDLCGVAFRPKAVRQRFCSRDCGQRGKHRPRTRVAQRKVERPPEDALRAELATSSYVAVGRRYGVSDNAVRKWLRAYEREREAADPASSPAVQRGVQVR